MRTISEALAELKVNLPNGKVYVHDWQKQIPSWSMWTPGSLGQPDCESCKGLGVLRVDVPHYRHPFFGKLFVCECAAGGVAPPPKRVEAGDKETIRASSIERVRKDLD